MHEAEERQKKKEKDFVGPSASSERADAFGQHERETAELADANINQKAG